MQAPPYAATPSFVPNVNLTNFVGNFSSARLYGSIATLSPADLITFTLKTDGGVLLWLDDHLIIDDRTTFNSVRTVSAVLNVAFVNASQTFKLDYMHYSGASILELSWKGNFTPPAVVPPEAFSSVTTTHEQQRTALRNRMMNPAQPWQTYFNPTMGCHVHMPEVSLSLPKGSDHLCCQRGFIMSSHPQSFSVDATLADLNSSDVLGNIIVFRGGNPAATYVGAHSYSGSVYTEVRLDRWGSRDCTVVLQTTVVGNEDLQFLATSNGTSCSGLALLISPALLWNRAGSITAISSTTTSAQVFGFANNFTVHAVGATPVPFSKGGPASWALPLAAAGSTSGVVGYSTGSSPLTVPQMQSAIAAAKAVQTDALLKWGPELSPVYEPQASILAWNTMYTPYEGVVTPVSRGWDFGSGYVLFDWDNYLLSYMASLEAESLDIAYSNLIQTTQMRTMEGFVPNFASGIHVSYDRTEPQIGAFVALQIYNKWGDGWVIDIIFDALLSWNDWVWTRRRGEGVLAGPDGHADLVVLGSDPNASPGGVNGGENTLQAARYESGLDNSPMYDGIDNGLGPVRFDNVTTHHMTLYDVGMTALYLSDTEALIALANARNRTDVVPTLQARFDRVSAALNANLWDNGTGLYTNVLYNGSFYARYAPTSMFPLISGVASEAQATSTVEFAASPNGFCLNTSYTPDPSASALFQWWDGHDNAAW